MTNPPRAMKLSVLSKGRADGVVGGKPSAAPSPRRAAKAAAKQQAAALLVVPVRSRNRSSSTGQLGVDR